MTRKTLALALFFLTALALPSASWSQAVYNGGKCGGAYTLLGGDTLTLTPGKNPAPDSLWIAVNSGGGYAILSDGSGGQTGSDFALKAGDLLIFPAVPQYTLYFQGQTALIYFGGTVVNRPGEPVCNTGLLGPIFFKVDRLLNLMTQSHASGTPKIQVWAWFQKVVKTSGSITYTLVSDPRKQGEFEVPACSGDTCCQPEVTGFALKNLSGGSYTLYELDAGGPYNFDWNTAVPSALTCTASASPASGTAPLDVSFSATAVGGSSGYRWRWTFGDGTSSTKQLVNHTYASGGKFSWKLTVTDMADQTCQRAGTVQVASPLSVTTTATPRQGDAPLTSTLSATASGAKPPYTYLWDFQDGTASDSATVSHTFVEQGAYPCTVTATDSEGKSAVGRAPVYVGVPVAPTILEVKAITTPAFQLKVTGADFQSGCSAAIEGQAVPEVKVKSASSLVFKGGKTLKALVPKGVSVCVVVTNPDGGVSDCFTYTR